MVIKYTGIASMICVMVCLSVSTKETQPSQQEQSSEYFRARTLDTIIAVIYGKDDTIVITQSDIARPGLDGSVRTLENYIMEELIYLDAKKFNMLSSEEDIDKHLASVQKNYNLTLDELKGVFKNSGYSYAEGRDQLGRSSAVQSIVDFKIRSRLVVTEQEVKEYYEAHPIAEQEAYQLQITTVPFELGKRKEDQKKELEKMVEGVREQDPLMPTDFTWSTPFWIERDNVAEEKQFISSMGIYDISPVQETDRGFEIIKLIGKREKRLKPLDDRYQEIADALRQPKYLELLDAYKKALRKTASVVYFDKK